MNLQNKLYLNLLLLLLLYTTSYAYDKGQEQAGLIPETEKSNILILANIDNYRPLLKFHKQMLADLPSEVGAIIISRSDVFYKKHFNEDINSERFKVIDIPNDSNWARDFFPEIVIDQNGKKKFVQFKYASGKTANNVGESIAKLLDIPLEKSRLYLEGGNLLVDDEQQLFITEKVFKWNTYHHKLSKKEIEYELKTILNIKKVHWLPILPHEKTSHVDIFMKYMGNDTMLVADSQNPSRKKVLDEVAKTISKNYRVVRIMNAEDSLNNAWTLSYTNSLILNGIVYVPKYDDGTDEYTAQYAKFDEMAIKVYKDLGYQVIAIPIHDMMFNQGAIHCLTKQLSLIGNSN
ncbi:MAG: agmatine deiminase family protein [Bacteriovoracaceae bacterium]|nr:agmatine deiminase family protein [Bacteriovoracaceae bacterium]